MVMVVTADALGGKKLPPGMWKALEHARWLLEVAGLRRGLELSHGPSPAFEEFLDRWHTKRAMSGEPAAPAALPEGAGAETVEAVLVDVGEIAGPAVNVEDEEERSDGDELDGGTYARATERRTAQQRQPPANGSRPAT
jgi:hypothetical protein